MQLELWHLTVVSTMLANVRREGSKQMKAKKRDVTWEGDDRQQRAYIWPAIMGMVGQSGWTKVHTC